MADFYLADADASCAGRVFLVQLSLDACPSSGQFRGRIQHMQSCDAAHFESLDELVQLMRLRVVVAAFDGPARAIACARALAGAAPRFGRSGHFGLDTGECDQTPEGRVAGRAYERARAVCEHAAAGEVLVSRTVTDLVAGSGLAFQERGTHRLETGGNRCHLFAAMRARGE
jgi:class 3 adenylate cyclase